MKNYIKNVTYAWTPEKRAKIKLSKFRTAMEKAEKRYEEAKDKYEELLFQTQFDEHNANKEGE